MKYSVFLPEANPELQIKLKRLIDLSRRDQNSEAAQNAPLWREDFFNVQNSPYWMRLSDQQKQMFLSENSQEILKEAICIEHAGIAYGNKMALSASTQDERHYYTCVAQEELNHLMWLRPYLDVQPEKNATSFAQMVDQIINSTDRRTSIVMIQVLLEGWGIHYYSSLVDGTDHIEIKTIFENILKDESRHHAGGILLFQHSGSQDLLSLLQEMQSLIDVVRIGPLQVVTSLNRLLVLQDKSEMVSLLESIEARPTTLMKLKVLEKLALKILAADQLSQLNFQPYSVEEMAELALSFLEIPKTLNQPTEADL